MTLKRSPLIRKTPLRSIARIKPRSAKRRSEADAYAELRAKLVLHPSARCQVCWEQNGQEHRPVDLHHRREMGMGGAFTNPANVIPVCRMAHDHIHDNAESDGWSRFMGYLVFEGDPEWLELGARAWRNR